MKYCPDCATALIQEDIDGRERRVCPACGYVLWNNPVPVVGAIVELGDEILLARKQEWPAGRWGLIAGFAEAGETMEEAVRREVAEETGLQGQVLDLVGVYSMPERNQVFIVYRVRAEPGPLQKGEELEALRSFRVEELPAVLDSLPEGSRAAWALREWLGRW